MLSLSYALAFKEDFPKVILTRSLVSILFILAILNVRIILKAIILIFTGL